MKSEKNVNDGRGGYHFAQQVAPGAQQVACTSPKYPPPPRPELLPTYLVALLLRVANEETAKLY